MTEMGKLYREKARTPSTASQTGRVDHQPQSVHAQEDRWAEAAARWRWLGPWSDLEMRQARLRVREQSK